MITFTHTNKLDWYDALALVFAVVMSMGIAKFFGWGMLGCVMSAFVLGILSPHLAAFLRHPPPQTQLEDKNSD